MTKKDRFHDLIATVFGAGYLPWAPGTWGSLVGLIFVWLLHDHIYFYICFFVIAFSLGVISADNVEKAMQQKDPSKVVIDEFACIFIAFLFIPITVHALIAGFVAYRLLDILKPPPCRMLEEIGGGWGIMLDDLAVGVYTNLFLICLNLFLAKT